MKGFTDVRWWVLGLESLCGGANLVFGGLCFLVI